MCMHPQYSPSTKSEKIKNFSHFFKVKNEKDWNGSKHRSECAPCLGKGQQESEGQLLKAKKWSCICIKKIRVGESQKLWNSRGEKFSFLESESWDLWLRARLPKQPSQEEQAGGVPRVRTDTAGKGKEDAIPDFVICVFFQFWGRWEGSVTASLALLLGHPCRLSAHGLWRCRGGLAQPHQPAHVRLGRLLCCVHVPRLLLPV